MMKKEFLENYFLAHQNEIENTYLKTDEEYEKLENELRECKKKFEAYIGKHDAELWGMYDEISTAYNNLEAYLIRMMYIRGFEDCDRMEIPL